jgi:endonuclease/exonuclease/phosphatase family metal-dependent hydrolase
MRTEFAIATWNIERPGLGSWKRLPAIRSQISTIAADIWVLTETRKSISPVDGFYGIHSPNHPARREDPDERWVSVWSRWPMRNLIVRESFWSATALVDAEFGQVIIHGIVLPYRNEPNPDGGKMQVWAEFSRELQLQSEDWARLRRDHPGVPMVVAGDLNQSLDGTNWYGSTATARALTVALNDADLQCLTKENVVESGKLKTDHLVDHVCVSAELTAEPHVTCWESVNDDSVRMSDHPGVVVSLTR